MKKTHQHFYFLGHPQPVIFPAQYPPYLDSKYDWLVRNLRIPIEFTYNTLTGKILGIELDPGNVLSVGDSVELSMFPFKLIIAGRRFPMVSDLELKSDVAQTSVKFLYFNLDLRAYHPFSEKARMVYEINKTMEEGGDWLQRAIELGAVEELPEGTTLDDLLKGQE